MAPLLTMCVMVLAAAIFVSGTAVVTDKQKENKAIKLTDDNSTVKKMLLDSNSIKHEVNVSSTVVHSSNDVLKEEKENKNDDKLLTNNVSNGDNNKRRTAPGRKPSAKKGKKSNSELLRDLGLTKIRTPNANHHRKRLASQSRKTHAQKQIGDSQMFIIKLPPHPYYYGHVKPNVVEPAAASEKSLTKTVNTLPVDFKFNGKPSRVYHWNLPVMKKMVARKTGGSGKMSVITGDSNIFDIKKQSTWDENDEDDPTLYRKTSYYRPRRPTKHTFFKYFTGNGRPQSFYVIEKSKKPVVTYHRLLP